jgi:hypothetical protein
MGYSYRGFVAQRAGARAMDWSGNLRHLEKGPVDLLHSLLEVILVKWVI